MEMVFPFRFSYLPENPQELEFFMIAREISKSDFFAFFANGSRKLLYVIVTEVTG